MATSPGPSQGEFFILGEDLGLYEQFVPRENFAEDEIRAKHSTRYFSTDGRSIHACSVSIVARKIAMTDLEKWFQPILQLTERVQTCEFIRPPDYYLPSAFALIPPNDRRKVKPALYGEHTDGIVTSLFGSGVRPLSTFARSVASPLAGFCSAYRLILLLHSEYPLDVSDPTQLLRDENKDIA
jgi:hypothetical protein